MTLPCGPILAKAAPTGSWLFDPFVTLLYKSPLTKGLGGNPFETPPVSQESYFPINPPTLTHLCPLKFIP